MLGANRLDTAHRVGYGLVALAFVFALFSGPAHFFFTPMAFIFWGIALLLPYCLVAAVVTETVGAFTAWRANRRARDRDRRARDRDRRGLHCLEGRPEGPGTATPPGRPARPNHRRQAAIPEPPRTAPDRLDFVSSRRRDPRRRPL